MYIPLSVKEIQVTKSCFDYNSVNIFNLRKFMAMYLTHTFYFNSVTKMDKYIKYIQVMSEIFNVCTLRYILYFERKVPALRTAVEKHCQ